jgi:hypothetical protein
MQNREPVFPGRRLPRRALVAGGALTQQNADLLGNTRMSADALPLYRLHELAFRTQYAELKERAAAAGELLPGTPGTLARRSGTGYTYWYRVFYLAPGKRAESLVGKDGDDDALPAARRAIAFASWAAAQVRDLRKLGFQVADKGVAAVMVALHNEGLLDAGLTLVGTLGYMAWLNELGAFAVAARTQDIDFAARRGLKLAVPRSFAEAVQASRLGFVPVPGFGRRPSTALKLEGREGLRVDLLAHGQAPGQTVAAPQLEWHAQTVPHFDYLLDHPEPAALLAGGHCIPVPLPRAERMVWHKLFSSAVRRGFADKAEKDLRQAATLAAVLVEQQDEDLRASYRQVPAAMRAAIRSRLPALRRLLARHPQAAEPFERALR